VASQWARGKRYNIIIPEEKNYIGFSIEFEFDNPLDGSYEVREMLAPNYYQASSFSGKSIQIFGKVMIGQ
jgi:hypothetical protein